MRKKLTTHSPAITGALEAFSAASFLPTSNGSPAANEVISRKLLMSNLKTMHQRQRPGGGNDTTGKVSEQMCYLR